MRVFLVDPSAYTPPYDHALASALARAGAEVELLTSPFPYGPVAAPEGYVRREVFYRRARGPAGSRVRQATKLASHLQDMARLHHVAGREADVVHFQWLTLPWLDRRLLPDRPLVVTGHDLLPREPRPGQADAQRGVYERADAVVVHSRYGRDLLAGLGVPSAKLHVIPHGAFTHLTAAGAGADGGGAAATGVTATPGPPALPPAPDRPPGPPGGPPDPGRPVVLFFGLLRPYKGLETLLEAWRGIDDAELWVVGRPRVALGPLRAAAPPGVRFVPRFVPDAELREWFQRAAVVVLPYARTERLDASGVLATALAFARPAIVSDVGGLAEMAGDAAVLVEPEDPDALRAAIRDLLDDPARRERLSAAARAAAAGRLSWERAAALTLELYRSLAAAPGCATMPSR